jgi:hypothetical protein
LQPLRLNLAIALAFIALTAIVTYPQVQGFATSVPYHSDPYFSMWRLGWVAHAIVRAPQSLFEANIFYPEHDTLGYSDAMLLPGVAVAPLFWVGIHPVVIYNLALFAAFALSGYAAFFLARLLTGSTAAAMVAGTIYAFSPSRFGHYMHLELQMVFWIPLSVLLIHRIAASGRMRDGVLLGISVACQMFSSVYAAIFFATYCVVFVPSLMIATGMRQARRLIIPVLVGAFVTAALVSPYALAYGRAERSVGTRTLDDVRIYSASLTNYFSAPAMNRLYGRTAITNRSLADEMNLSPGLVAIVLALVGATAGVSRARFAYLAALIFAFDMTMGVKGVFYPWLFEYVPTFRALRSAARISILVNLSLAVLSAYGAAFLLARFKREPWRRTMGVILMVLLITEYASAPVIVPAPNPSKVDMLLAERPPAVIVEMPLASPANNWDSRDWLYMYQGMPHFQRMLNGYSGYAPASYYQMRDTMASFPDDRSIAFLRERHVHYVVVRAGLFEADERAALLEQISKRDDLSLEAMWPGGPQGAEAMYALSPTAQRAR